MQEVQFTTLGDNVSAVAVEGTFDDCQRLVKAAFADPALAAAHRLTSANSINIGRLLPQMAYYAWAVLQLPAGAPPPTIVVPSGNLGNLTAGVMAARRGVPIGHFVVGHHHQRSVPALPRDRRLRAGRCGADAGERDGRRPPEQFRAADRGSTTAIWRGCAATITGVVVTDDEVRAAMRELHARYGYIADPHTAVGWRGAELAAADAGAPHDRARHGPSGEVPRSRRAHARSGGRPAAGPGRPARARGHGGAYSAQLDALAAHLLAAPA